MVDELILGATAGMSVAGTVLINKVADAVGGVVRPWQIQRVREAEAKGEAKRALILAESEIEVTDRQRRAALRWLEEETKNQENIENITYQAIPHLKEDADPENVEDDFLRNFFDKCRLVSDEQMQDLWARILAGEANNPGTFSRKTINILADMDADDAELYSNFCRFMWVVNRTLTAPFQQDSHLFQQYGIGIGQLADIEALGLVHTATFPYSLTDLPKQVLASYFGDTLEVTLKADTSGTLEIGTVIITAAGRQVASICQRQPIEGFLEFMRNRWENDSNVECVRMLG